MVERRFGKRASSKAVRGLKRHCAVGVSGKGFMRQIFSQARKGEVWLSNQRASRQRRRAVRVAGVVQCRKILKSFRKRSQAGLVSKPRLRRQSAFKKQMVMTKKRNIFSNPNTKNPRASEHEFQEWKSLRWPWIGSARGDNNDSAGEQIASKENGDAYCGNFDGIFRKGKPKREAAPELDLESFRQARQDGGAIDALSSKDAGQKGGNRNRSA